ncbi:MAG: DUF1453 family protein [Proteobacteria bacterium]|nr:DUF1453 family protein [Pseudomonadota bacterium]
MAAVPWGQLLPLAIVAMVLVWRFRRMARSTPLTPWRLWLMPLILLAMTLAVLSAHPPDGRGWLAFGGALALGAALGWQRGRLTLIERDAASGQLMMRQSPAGMLLLVAVVAVRFLLRGTLGAEVASGQAPSPAVWLLTDGMVGFALGFLGVFRLELGLRARQL